MAEVIEDAGEAGGDPAHFFWRVVIGPLLSRPYSVVRTPYWVEQDGHLAGLQ
jgi:hypothetical protein